VAAKEGTLFCLGEKRHSNPEGDDTVEYVWAQIYRTKDEPTPTKPLKATNKVKDERSDIKR